MTSPSSLGAAMDILRSTAERMRGDSRFKLVFEEYRIPPESDVADWEEWLGSQPGFEGYRIPPALRAVYAVTGGFRWRWQRLPDLPKATVGSAEIVTLFSLYQRDDEATEPLSKIYEVPRKFDVISALRHADMVFSRGSANVSLRFVDDEAGTSEPLRSSPEEYLLSVARFRALAGWQEMFLSMSAADESRMKAWEKRASTLFSESEG